MSDNPGWAAWRHNFDAAHVAYVQTLIQLASCNGTVKEGHEEFCRGMDCDSDLWDLGYVADNLAPGAAREIEEDLHAFITSCLGEHPDCFDQMTPDMVGYDFYLARNGYGAGFWDRGLGELGRWLTAIAKPFGEASVYVGDDDNLYYC